MSPPPLAQVRVDWHGDVPVAAVEGEVDASNAAELGGELRELVTNRSTQLVVDLGPTQYLDSAGINLLFNLEHELRAHQVVLRLVVDPESPVARMLALTGLDKADPTFPTVGRRARRLNPGRARPINPSMPRTRLVVLVTLLVAAAPAVATAAVGGRPAAMSALLHFCLVSTVAALTSGASVALSLAGARARDGRTVLMGTAFSTMTALFTVHALATPGFLVGPERRDRAGRRAVDPGRRPAARADRAARAAPPPAHRPLLVALQVALFAGVIGPRAARPGRRRGRAERARAEVRPGARAAGRRRRPAWRC